jgi:hypothetical protein
MVGVGTPVAVMLNVGPTTLTVYPPVDAALVNKGATGASEGVNALLATDAGPAPMALLAITVHVYD